MGCAKTETGDFSQMHSFLCGLELRATLPADLGPPKGLSRVSLDRRSTLKFTTNDERGMLLPAPSCVLPRTR